VNYETHKISTFLRYGFFSAVSVGLFLPVFAFAQTPSMPHQFFGTVKFTDGVAVPNGMTVKAKINGSVAGSSVTANGNYGYSPNLLFALDNQGVNAGKTVEFYVDGVKANTFPESAIFMNGNSSQVNLTIPTPTTPTPTSGGGGVTTPPSSPLTSPLSAAAEKVDANKDNKIDVLDFNTLMVNWGKTTANNVADFNEDGKVDVFDFNLLMINWTL
jgi:hypothetical protein